MAKRVRSIEKSGPSSLLEWVNAEAVAAEDMLRSYECLLAWLGGSGLLDDQTEWELGRGLGQKKVEALAVLRRAKSLRHAAREILLAITHRQAPSSADLEALNRELSRTMSHAALTSNRGRLAWSWQAADKSLDRALWPLVEAAADLLTSPDLQRIRACASPTCGRLFLDTSKNASKRWCDMNTCGNRAKVRLHRQRKAEGLPPVRPGRQATGRPPKPTPRQQRDDSFID